MMDKSKTRSEQNGEQSSTNRTEGQDSGIMTTCPECQGKVTRDQDLGEETCEDCGLVLDEDAIDRGPEWRAYDTDEQEEKSRIGAPMTQLLHDKGLSTTVGWQNKDAQGRAISARKRAQLQRLRSWDERFRTKDAREKNLKHALGEIDRMASALDLPESVRETAAVIYRRALEEDLLPGRSIEGMATAALYAAARQQEIPRQLTEFADVSRVERLRIQRAYRYLSRELGLAIEPAEPTQYLPQFASSLEVCDETERVAQELLEVTAGTGVHSGKSAAALAAGALYAAAQLTEEKLTQGEVSTATDMSKVTIRNRYQELLEMYTEHE